ncbi:MAG: hypothetical protein D6712_17850 [Chloroflexi bacterium]|nr:MAG: hypothetical protein D6712_17850 [Chloroflexota bacterium]
MTHDMLTVMGGIRTELLKDGVTVLVSGTKTTATYPCLIIFQRGGTGSRSLSPWTDADIQVSVFGRSRAETYQLSQNVMKRLNKKRFAAYGIDWMRCTGSVDLPVQDEIYQRVLFFRTILKEEV